MVDGLGTYHRLESAYQSPRLLARAAGLTVYPEGSVHDWRHHQLRQAGTPWSEQVTIVRAKPFTVKVDGKVRNPRTQGHDVGDALADAGIALGLQRHCVSAAS